MNYMMKKGFLEILLKFIHILKRVKTFVCNILNEEVSTLLSEKLDFCTMIFFLSSFLKKDLETVVQKIDKVMKQGF